MYITGVNVIKIFILGKRAKVNTEKIVLHLFLKSLGAEGLNITDDSSERFQGGGSFSILKLCCRFWTFQQGFLGGNLKHELEGKMGGREGRVKGRGEVKGCWGGQKAVWNFSEN